MWGLTSHTAVFATRSNATMATSVTGNAAMYVHVSETTNTNIFKDKIMCERWKQSQGYDFLSILQYQQQ